MLEIPRLVLMVVMLGIASYHDIRTREIPDYIWIVGGGVGAALYVFDWNEVDMFAVFAMISGGMAALAVWRLFPMGGADALAILAVSVSCPVSFGVMNPLVVFFGGLILEHIAAFFYNLRYNVEDLARGRLYDGVENSLPVKIMAFYSVHLRRPGERFTFCAERSDGYRRIDLRTSSPRSEYETRGGVFVTWAMPAFPFMLAALIMGVAFGAAFI